jgi:uncharacterized membrane protein
MSVYKQPLSSQVDNTIQSLIWLQLGHHQEVAVVGSVCHRFSVCWFWRRWIWHSLICGGGIGRGWMMMMMMMIKIMMIKHWLIISNHLIVEILQCVLSSIDTKHLVKLLYLNCSIIECRIILHSLILFLSLQNF